MANTPAGQPAGRLSALQNEDAARWLSVRLRWCRACRRLKQWLGLGPRIRPAQRRFWKHGRRPWPSRRRGRS